MCLQPSPWPDTTGCVRLTSAVEKTVDGVTEGEVRSETGKKGLFIDVTTVLPAFAPVGHPTDTLSGVSRGIRPAPQGCQKVQNGKTAA